MGRELIELGLTLQAGAGESSRINDPTLVRWTDEALNYILTSATSSSPVPLALFLRGDLSSSGGELSPSPKLEQLVDALPTQLSLPTSPRRQNSPSATSSPPRT